MEPQVFKEHYIARPYTLYRVSDIASHAVVELPYISSQQFFQAVPNGIEPHPLICLALRPPEMAHKYNRASSVKGMLYSRYGRLYTRIVGNLQIGIQGHVKIRPYEYLLALQIKIPYRLLLQRQIPSL